MIFVFSSKHYREYAGGHCGLIGDLRWEGDDSK